MQYTLIIYLKFIDNDFYYLLSIIYVHEERQRFRENDYQLLYLVYYDILILGNNMKIRYRKDADKCKLKWRTCQV